MARASASAAAGRRKAAPTAGKNTSAMRKQPLRQSRRVACSSNEIPATDDSEGDDIVLSSNTRVVKEVSIPVALRSPRGKGRFSAAASSTNSTTIPSISSSPRASSADYETAGTTPAMSTRNQSIGKRKRSSLLRDERVEDSQNETDLGDSDAILARKLQQEEYDAEEPVTKRPKTKSTSVQDSVDDEMESELSDLESLDSTYTDDSLSNISGHYKAAAETAPLSSRRKGKQPVVHAPRATRTRGATVQRAGENSVGDGEVPKRSLFEIFRNDKSESEQSHASEFSSASSIYSESDIDAGDMDAGDMDAGDIGAGDVGTNNAVADNTASHAPRQPGRGRRSTRRGNRARSGMLTRRYRERKRLERTHPSIKTMWTELDASPVITPVAVEQPQSISRRLKPFQLEGLDWMMKQEQTKYKGGLLGDEMGMGKTIQAVSLIMSDYPQKQPTLVVVPPVALMQWTSEIRDYTDGKLNVLVYHGQNGKVKSMSVKQLEGYDVIMISYNSLESMYRKQTKGWSRGEDIVKEDSAIHAIDFHRLILDEAHSIKSRTTGVAKACFALRGKYKWCLSGTPVQNRIGEFFSLLRFLEVRPFGDYFCKRCPCAFLHWSVDANRRCTACNHSSVEHVSVFNQELLNPLTEPANEQERSAAMSRLHMITKRIMLRRLKRDHTGSMELPPKEIVLHNEFFGEIERDFSSSIMSNTARQFDTYVSRGVMLNNYANIFGLIMQMRQVANHPDLLLKKQANGGQNVLVCNICDEVAEDAIRSKCKHDFCRTCVKSYVQTVEESGGDADCPRCHIPLSIDFDQPEIEQDEEDVKKSSIVNRIRMENWTSSTKIEMLVYDLWKMRSKKQTIKSIVFSQFTSMLQLIEWRLRRAGFNTVMLDGSMTPIQRQRSIDYFMKNADVEVFLVSLKAGGVALNLTEASMVFLVEPHWNPAAEWQSADRCHRIGQRRPCMIKRLCIEDSVESRMVQLMEKKTHMINSTVNSDRASFDRLTPEDMHFLFRGS